MTMSNQNDDNGEKFSAASGDSQRHRPTGKAAHGTPPPWVRRLFAARGLVLQERQLYWYGVHWER